MGKTFLFHSDEFYEETVQETNNYASYCQKDRYDSKCDSNNTLLIHINMTQVPQSVTKTNTVCQ
jgi:hypothetical protein